MRLDSTGALTAHQAPESQPHLVRGCLRITGTPSKACAIAAWPLKARATALVHLKRFSRHRPVTGIGQQTIVRSWPAAGGHERRLRRCETREAAAERRAALGKPDGRVWVDSRPCRCHEADLPGVIRVRRLRRPPRPVGCGIRRHTDFVHRHGFRAGPFGQAYSTLPTGTAQRRAWIGLSTAS